MARDSSFHDELFSLIHGYFPVPNFLVDIVQPVLTPAEWKILTLIWRETVGRQRWSARLSLTLIARLTRTSRPTVARTSRLFEDLRLFTVEDTGINTFTVNRNTLELLTQISKGKHRIESLQTLRFYLKEHAREGSEEERIPAELWEELLAISRGERSLSEDGASVSISDEDDNDGEDHTVSEPEAR